jgi:hypothetical protein
MARPVENNPSTRREPAPTRRRAARLSEEMCKNLRKRKAQHRAQREKSRVDHLLPTDVRDLFAILAQSGDGSGGSRTLGRLAG